MNLIMAILADCEFVFAAATLGNKVMIAGEY